MMKIKMYEVVYNIVKVPVEAAEEKEKSRGYCRVWKNSSGM